MFRNPFKRDKTPVFPAAPLGLTPGCSIEVDEFVFLETPGHFPQPTEAPVVAIAENIGFTQMENDWCLFTAQLSIPGWSFQMAVNPEGKAEETRLYFEIHTETPGTPEDWQLWEEELIGYHSFQIPGNIIEHAPVYQRIWGSEHNEMMSAVEIEEERFFANDRAPVDVTHKMMRYARSVEPGELTCEQPKTEWLDIQISESEDNEAWISLSIGYDLSPGEFRVF